MKIDTRDDLEHCLNLAVAHITSDDLPTAKKLLDAALRAKPDEPFTLHLRGIVHFKCRQWKEAEEYFRRALALSPDQPQVALYLAQTLMALQRPAEALLYCQMSVKAMPDDPDALLELARAQDESGAPESAESSYRQILARGWDNGAVTTLRLSSLLCRTQRVAEAETLLRQALKNPIFRTDNQLQATLEHQLGHALKRGRRHEEALAHMDAAKVFPDRSRALDKANVLEHLGRMGEAAAIYEGLIAERPEDLKAHLLLNEVLYRNGHLDRFLASYDTAQLGRPRSNLLMITKGTFLLKLQRPADALEAFQMALGIAPDNAAALSGIARSLDAMGDIENALVAHKKGVSQNPNDGDTLEEYTSFLLRRYDPHQALACAEQAHALRPTSQSALALLGLCYRACNDAREEQLNSYNSFIQIFDLDPPEGYPDMHSFNRDLASYLDSLHQDSREYFTQTLRGGTRIYDEAFYNGHKLIDLLVPKIGAAVQSYGSRLDSVSGHPFVARRSKGFRYSGSWSSRLNDRGFHVNHIHQDGWISSCYYVAVPDIVKGDAAREGWITFGEPSEEYGSGYSFRRAVQPIPGRLVLFPSYMWHGTVPFHSPQSRITVAFDAVPA